MPVTTEPNKTRSSSIANFQTSGSTRPAAAILADYRRHDPYRPLNWRWQHATELLELGEEPDPVFDDAWTHRAFDFLRLSVNGPAESLFQAMPEVFAAHQIHCQGGVSCWELQARILARETPDCIAAKTGVASTVVECYEKHFFAVGERIDIPTYIEATAIGSRPFAADDIAAVWKYFGYWYGPYLLDAVIDDFVKSGKPDYRHLLAKSNWWRNRTRFQRLLDRTIGLLLFEVTVDNLAALLRLQRMVSISIQCDDFAVRHEGLQELIDEAMFDLFSTSSDDTAAARTEEELAA